jgi:hypothetical protein
MTEVPTPIGDSPEDAGRRRAREAERIEHLRERLYSRGDDAPRTNFVRHDLAKTAHSTPQRPQNVPLAQPPATPVAGVTPVLAADQIREDMTRTSKRSSFRLKSVIIGIAFLIGALAVSSAFLFMGKNTISGNNIGIDVSGPVAVGGGDVMDFQIAIMNSNTLPIESATLIVTYPRGAQSVTEPGKELFTDRQQLNSVDPGEVVNVPIRFFVFGEENDEKEVKVAVEYRVRGSNATFYKEALPFGFRITSSPIIVNIDAVKSIASGQETEMEIEIQSNARETLHDLLLKVSYPAGFDFTESDPETASGQDTWKLTALKPGEKQTITVSGVMTGKENDENEFDFTVGVANERDSFSIVSPLAAVSHSIKIERPFLDVDVLINGNSDEVVVVDPNSSASVAIEFKNALDTTIYDGVIFVELGGNALSEVDIKANDGEYDSRNNTISWDSVDVKALEEMIPGETNRVTFTVQPREDIDATPEIKLKVTTQANRVGEDRVAEQVVGTVERTIKISSATKLTSAAFYTDGPYTNSGPTPPVAEETTQYTFHLAVRNGTNPVTDAEVTAVMPSYVSWLDITSDDDAVRYTASSRTLKWDIDELEANEYKEVWIQVAVTPSMSHVGLTPTILETQRYRATDRFTGTVIRTEASALTTFLSQDPDPGSRDGRVEEPN